MLVLNNAILFFHIYSTQQPWQTRSLATADIASVIMTAMMNDLKWESLEARRNNQRLTMLYRMQHNMVSITPADHFVPV